MTVPNLTYFLFLVGMCGPAIALQLHTGSFVFFVRGLSFLHSGFIYDQKISAPSGMSTFAWQISRRDGLLGPELRGWRC